MRFYTFTEWEMHAAMRALHHAFRGIPIFSGYGIVWVQVFTVAFEDGDDEPESEGDEYQFGHAMQPD